MIDANDIERMAKERPDACFLKGSGVLKLTGAIRELEGQVRTGIMIEQNLNDRIAELERQVAELRDTLQGIAEADWRKWEELASPREFERWVKARANHALAQAKKEGA